MCVVDRRSPFVLLMLKFPALKEACGTGGHLQDLNITGYNGQRVELLLGASINEAILQQE